MAKTNEILLTIPKDAGLSIVRAGSIIACPLLRTDDFVKFGRERGFPVDRERLLRLERLGLFAPVFRVKTPDADVRHLAIPPKKDNDWFEKGWAWDTTALELNYAVPDSKDRTQEAYYSIFQIDHLDVLLSAFTLSVHMDGFLPQYDGDIPADWENHGRRWIEMAEQQLHSLRKHEYRRSKALLCQFISDRYYPKTQGDQRTIEVAHTTSSDSWITITARDWDWYELARQWDPTEVERLFELTPEKLAHAYRGLATSQAYIDPLSAWYQLIQFVSVTERRRLKGHALRAETLRSGALMLRLLYKDLYGEELAHPNEVMGTIITHFPELDVRGDTRRYLEFVANRFGVNPQPKVTLIVEGETEEAATIQVFEQYFGAHPGTHGIEIVVLGGVDVATGTKEDRFRAIIRLIDYLHHHQTLTFLILDNERYARKLKHEAAKASSIHRTRRFATRPEYIKVWKTSFEFDNFSSTEIADSLNGLAGEHRFTRTMIEACRASAQPGAELKRLYRDATGKNPDKLKLTQLLVERMFARTSRRKVENRPFVKTLGRVSELAAMNPFPVMHEIWAKNQSSKVLAKKGRNRPRRSV